MEQKIKIGFWFLLFIAFFYLFVNWYSSDYDPVTYYECLDFARTAQERSYCNGLSGDPKYR